MGQSLSRKWRVTDDSFARIKSSSRRKNNKIFVKEILQDQNIKTSHTSHTYTNVAFIMDPLGRASSVMDGQEINGAISERKSSTQPQPQPQPEPSNQPRRPSKYQSERVIDDIMDQSLNATDSYSLNSSSVEQQAQKFPDFVGDAHFYLLDKAKVSRSTIRR